MTSPAPITTPLEIKLDYITFMMDVVNERAKAIASAVYEKEVGLSLRELRLMRFIATQPGLTISRLIQQTHLEKTLASKAIAGLTRRGLVLRAISKSDARQINLYLTHEGAARVNAADSIGQRMEKAMMSGVSEADLAIFKRCLETIEHCVDFSAMPAKHEHASSGKNIGSTQLQAPPAMEPVKKRPRQI